MTILGIMRDLSGFTEGARKVDGSGTVYIGRYLVLTLVGAAISDPAVVAEPLNTPGCVLVSLHTWRELENSPRP